MHGTQVLQRFTLHVFLFHIFINDFDDGKCITFSDDNNLGRDPSTLEERNRNKIMMTWKTMTFNKGKYMILYLGEINKMKIYKTRNNWSGSSNIDKNVRVIVNQERVNDVMLLQRKQNSLLTVVVYIKHER